MVVFKPGDTILTSKPYVYILCNKHRGTRCDFCFKKTQFLKHCGKCKFVNYCNKSCQVPAWETHKMECKFLRKKLIWTDDTVRMVSMVILKLKKYGPDDPSETVYGRKVTFGSLMSHAEDLKRSEWRSTGVRALKHAVEEFIGEENTPSLDEFFEIFGKININQFSMKDAFVSVGAGLYLGASVIDHSCDPSAVDVFYGTDIWIRAMKRVSIQENDMSQVTISYVSEVELPDVRQRILADYFFECQCTRCNDKEWVEGMTKVLLPDEIAIPYVAELKDILERIREPKSLVLFDLDIGRLENLIKRNILADTHVIKIKVLQTLYAKYVKYRNQEKALIYGLQLLESYRLYYGPYYPRLGNHLFEIADISFDLGHFAQFITFRKEAKDVLKVAMGEEHPLFQTFFKNDFYESVT